MVNHNSENNNQTVNISSQIQAEQTRLLYSAMPLSVLATVLIGTILIAVQWNVIEHDKLISWYSALILVMFSRAVLTVYYHKSTTKESAAKLWSKLFNLGVILTALVWACFSIWLFPAGNIANQVFLALAIAGMSAGATTSLSFQRLPILFFLHCLLIPLAIQFFLLGDGISLAMGSMNVMFYIMLVFSSLRIYKNTADNISLRISAHLREKARRESEEKYRHIFKAAPLGIIHYDKSAVISDANETFSELVMSDRDGILGINLLVDTADKDLQQTVARSLLGEAGQFVGKINAFWGKGESDIRMHCRGIETSEGEYAGGVAIVEDISEDTRVRKMKEEFISTVSHELRTPLTAIRGAVGLLQGGAIEELSSSTTNMLDIARKNTERLLLLINDILDVSKIESGKMSFDFRPFNIVEFMQEAVRINDSYAKQYNVHIVITNSIEETSITGDRDRLMQVMYNLLSNAAKFSPKDEKVEVSIEKKKDNMLRILVSDHGDGIDKKFQPMMFDRFTQQDASDSRRAGGTGLGLSISKSIVEKHNGSIGFDTGQKGTTFYIDLPIHR